MLGHIDYPATFDYVVWNTPHTRLRHDPALLAPQRRNLLWMMPTDRQNRASMMG